jgi:glycosyltransferase involved in cell wall biosynthesis
MESHESPVRVMHVIETLENGGAERVLASIANNLPPQYRSYVCCLKNSGPVSEQLRNLERPIFELRRKSGNSYVGAMALAKVIRHNRIDIVHAHNWSTFCESIIGGHIARVKKIVNTIHGIHFSYLDNRPPIAKRILRNAVEKMICRASSNICAVSENVRRHIVQDVGLSDGNISVIYNGISAGGIDNGREEPIAERRSPEFVVCWAGRLATVKSLPNLLQAVAILKSRNVNISVNLVGDGPERESLVKEMNSLGIEDRIRFIGYTPDVRPYLSAADVFVLPSQYEGFSMALLEAMSAGLPVVASNVGGNPEIVVDGATGLLVKSGDSLGLAESLLTLYRDHDLKTRMGQEGKRRVMQEFSTARMISEYVRVYQA